VDEKPTALTQFVESYALHSANRDFNALVAQFAETFVVAGPAGAHCVGAADFLRVLPKRVELFASLGCQSSELIDMQNSWLDSRYAHVRTTWRFTFQRSDTTETVDSESIFLIDTGSDPYRILVYLTPRDIMDTLLERGIAA
jgi:hypothetical protein